MFWRRKEKKPPCKHDYVLNEVYGLPINAGVEVIVEDRYILFCNNCQTEKDVDEFDFDKMKKYGLIKG